MMKSYKRKTAGTIVAIQLKFEELHFTFKKWQASQKCKSGDWLVENQGDVYTVDEEEFARTYEKVSKGIYKKTSIIWANQAQSIGHIKTIEGKTHYKNGDFLIANEKNGEYLYAISNKKFHQLYETV